jgi:hypothetical protein
MQKGQNPEHQMLYDVGVSGIKQQGIIRLDNEFTGGI